MFYRYQKVDKNLKIKKDIVYGNLVDIEAFFTYHKVKYQYKTFRKVYPGLKKRVCKYYYFDLINYRLYEDYDKNDNLIDEVPRDNSLKVMTWYEQNPPFFDGCPIKDCKEYEIKLIKGKVKVIDRYGKDKTKN